MINIYSPNDEVELSMIRGLLESEGVNFYVHNDHYGSMEIGPRIDLINKKTVLVAPEDADRARLIISDFLESSTPEETEEVLSIRSVRNSEWFLRQCYFAGLFRAEKGGKKASRPGTM